MKWIKASERLPDKPGKYLFKYSDGENLDTAYIVVFINKEHIKNHIDAVQNKEAHQWLDESPALVEDRADGWIRKGLPEKREGWSNSLDVNILIYHDGIYTVSTGSYSYQLNEWCDYCLTINTMSL